MPDGTKYDDLQPIEPCSESTNTLQLFSVQQALFVAGVAVLLILFAGLVFWRVRRARPQEPTMWL